MDGQVTRAFLAQNGNIKVFAAVTHWFVCVCASLGNTFKILLDCGHFLVSEWYKSNIWDISVSLVLQEDENVQRCVQLLVVSL